MPGTHPLGSPYVDMRIVVAGHRHWQCDEPAEWILNRLLARYGPDLVMVHV